MNIMNIFFCLFFAGILNASQGPHGIALTNSSDSLSGTLKNSPSVDRVKKQNPSRPLHDPLKIQDTVPMASTKRTEVK